MNIEDIVKAVIDDDPDLANHADKIARAIRQALAIHDGINQHYQQTEKNYRLAFQDTKNLSDEELDNIEGPRCKLFAMFDDWQPARWTIGLLSNDGVSIRDALRYLRKFKQFYLDKPHCVYYKTEWNNRFRQHCIRLKGWELSTQEQAENESRQADKEIAND